MSINPILNIETITKDDENLFSLSGVRAITLYGTFFYHRDHQGSIIALTDEYGDVVERIEYDEHYGHIIKHTKNSEVETLNPYGYTGREIETNELYYYRARYYDAQTQRFISVDPIGFLAGDFNFYPYVGNRPLNFRDAFGLEEKPYNYDFAMSSDNFASYKFLESHPDFIPDNYISDKDIATFRVLDSEYLANEYAKRRQQKKWDREAAFKKGERKCAENKANNLKEEKANKKTKGKVLDVTGLALSVCAAASGGKISKGCAVASIAIDLYQKDPCGAALGGLSMLPLPEGSKYEILLDGADIAYGINALGADGEPICPMEINWNSFTENGIGESIIVENKDYKRENHLMGLDTYFEK